MAVRGHMIVKLYCVSRTNNSCIRVSTSLAGSSLQYCSPGLQMVYMLSNRQKAAVSATHQLIQMSLHSSSLPQ